MLNYDDFNMLLMRSCTSKIAQCVFGFLVAAMDVFFGHDAY